MFIESTNLTNIEAERELIGILLSSQAAVPAVVAILAPTDFAAKAQQMIYRAIIDLAAQGQTADPASVSGLLRGELSFGAAQGESYLAELRNAVTSRSAAKDYARVICHLAHIRR